LGVNRQERLNKMFKVFRKAVLIAVIALIAVSSLAAKTDVVTLRLRATVPPKTAVSFIDNDIKVDMNTENVAFQAFDESGNVISTDSSFIAESGTVRLSFTAA